MGSLIQSHIRCTHRMSHSMDSEMGNSMFLLQGNQVAVLPKSIILWYGKPSEFPLPIANTLLPDSTLYVTTTLDLKKKRKKKELFGCP